MVNVLLSRIVLLVMKSLEDEEDGDDDADDIKTAKRVSE